MSFSFSPGIFPSEMTGQSIILLMGAGELLTEFDLVKSSGEDQKSHIPAEGIRERKGIPAGRPGKDDDIAQLVLMLAVNTYINGEVV
jgi:hypothetical protein